MSQAAQDLSRASRPAGRLRVFSANLLHGRADSRALTELLQTHAVDVAAFQEISDQQRTAVASVLSHGSLEIPSAPGMALALRHPAVVEPIPRARQNALCAQLEPRAWPELTAPIEILTTHIRAPHLWPPWRTFPRRRVQLRGLQAHLRAFPERTCVLVGDLNATPLWPVYRRLSALLEDAAVVHAARQGRRPERTWKLRMRGPQLLRLDHGLTRGVEVHDFQVLPVRGSDHFGILVEVSPSS